MESMRLVIVTAAAANPPTASLITRLFADAVVVDKMLRVGFPAIPSPFVTVTPEPVVGLATIVRWAYAGVALLVLMRSPVPV